MMNVEGRSTGQPAEKPEVASPILAPTTII
jgi:hypothetical protein